MRVTVVFGFLLLMLLFLRFYHFHSYQDVLPLGEEVEIRHTFLRDAQVRGYYQYFHHSDITVYADAYPRYEYGDAVVVRGEIEEREIGESGAFRLVMSDPEIVKIESPLWLGAVSLFRARVVEVFQHYLGRDEAGLLLGIVFGVREGLSAELSDTFRGTGVMHVVAASGANVVLVSGFLMAIFGRIASRAVQVVIVSSGIIFYAILSGGDASILRASVMGVFAYSAAILGRQYSGYFGLFVGCWLLLMITPRMWQDIGFLLSVSSTFGILLFQLPMERVIGGVRAFAITEDFSTSIAATVGNLPILLYFFGVYPLLSIFVNILVLWTIVYLMILGGLAAVVGIIWEVLAAPFLYLAMPLLKYFLWVVHLFPQDLQFQSDYFSIYFVLGYYCILIAGIMGWRKFKG